MTWLLSTIFVALLLCFVAGLVPGLAFWWLRRKAETADFERRRLADQAETDGLRDAAARVPDLEGEVAELRADAERTRDLKDRLLALQSEAQKTESLRDELAATNAELDEARRRAERLELDLTKARAEASTHRSDATRTARQATELRSAAKRVPDLESELIDLRAAAARLPQLEAELAEVRAQLLRAGTAGADPHDLKAIKGIGPVMEQTLNGLGIHTWEQIAAFTPADVARVGEAIGSFSDRIERDDWVGGAKRLIADNRRPPDEPTEP